MRFKTFLLLLFFVFCVIDIINARRTSSGRISSSHRSSSSRRPASHRPSHSGSSSHSTIGNHGLSSGHRPIGTGTSTGVHSVSHSTGSSPGSATREQSKNINTNFLNAEGGGARRPAETKPAGTSFGTSYPSATGQSHPPNTGGRPGFVTESRQQTSSGIQPTAPKEHVLTPTSTYQNQGQVSPAWSNPYLGTNRPNAPNAPSHTQPHWSHHHSSGINRTTVSSQTHTPWSNPYSGTNQPAMPGSYSPPIGFQHHVYPQNHPTHVGSQFGQPPISGYPAYPHSAPSGGPWSAPSYHSPHYPPNSMPMGNPYSMHPPGNAYSAPGNAYNAPGHTYYPQQPQVLAQPAAQPFIPGQTVIMVPGQQDSGRGFGQMVKEALVFSTINAGVNRLINPHTHHHYVESSPASNSASSPASNPASNPAPTTHITYNNQYFNTAPGMNDTASPMNAPQGTVPAGNYVNPNVGAGSMPSSGSANAYPASIPNGGVSNPVNGTVNGGGGTITGDGGPTAGGGGTITRTGTNKNTVERRRSGASSNQENPTANPNAVSNMPLYRISDDELSKITEVLFAKSLIVSKHIKLNLQHRTTSSNITDEAKEPLFDIDPQLLEYPSIYVTRLLYDSYEHDFRKKLNRTLETRKNENLLIDTFLDTNVMATAMQWLSDRGFIDPDDFEKKDVLRRVWFTMFSGSTCGFERVFASENYGTAIIGVQDWIYFADQESLKRIDYMSYADQLNLGDSASLLKLNFQMDGIVRPNATIFVGTMPELEMSLYTICFYARPNNLCPVSLGGTKFNIYTHSFTYFGIEVIDLGLPIF